MFFSHKVWGNEISGSLWNGLWVSGPLYLWVFWFLRLLASGYVDLILSSFQSKCLSFFCEYNRGLVNKYEGGGGGGGGGKGAEQLEK